MGMAIAMLDLLIVVSAVRYSGVFGEKLDVYGGLGKASSVLISLGCFYFFYYLIYLRVAHSLLLEPASCLIFLFCIIVLLNKDQVRPFE